MLHIRLQALWLYTDFMLVIYSQFCYISTIILLYYDREVIKFMKEDLDTRGGRNLKNIP
jgi:hypothetical protein